MTPTRPLWLTHTSPSRKPLFDGCFLPSMLRSGLTVSCELRVNDFGFDSVFGQAVFGDGVQRRTEQILKAFNENDGRLIIHSGDDLYIYGTDSAILDEFEIALRYVDLVAMRDSPDGQVICPCLFAARSTYHVRKFIQAWMESRAKLPDYPCDQARFNYVIRQVGLSFGRLPTTFWTHGLVTGQRFIDDVSKLPDPPEGILVHHANYCITTECKVNLINEIKRRVSASRAMA